MSKDLIIVNKDLHIMTMKTIHSISSDFKIRRPSFVVVMSTFNGEKYLNEQIESIINQK